MAWMGYCGWALRAESSSTLGQSIWSYSILLQLSENTQNSCKQMHNNRKLWLIEGPVNWPLTTSCKTMCPQKSEWCTLLLCFVSFILAVSLSLSHSLVNSIRLGFISHNLIYSQTLIPHFLHQNHNFICLVKAKCGMYVMCVFCDACADVSTPSQNHSRHKQQ